MLADAPGDVPCRGGGRGGGGGCGAVRGPEAPVIFRASEARANLILTLPSARRGWGDRTHPTERPEVGVLGESPDIVGVRSHWVKWQESVGWTRSMATNDVFSLHTKGGFDLQDLVVAPAFSLAAVVLTGIGTFSLFGHSLDQTLLSGSGMSVSLAFVIALVALVASWATNRAGDGWDDLDEIESAAVAGGGIVLVGMAFIPAVQDAVMGSQAIGAVAFLALSAAYTVTAWY